MDSGKEPPAGEHTILQPQQWRHRSQCFGREGRSGSVSGKERGGTYHKRDSSHASSIIFPLTRIRTFKVSHPPFQLTTSPVRVESNLFFFLHRSLDRLRLYFCESSIDVATQYHQLTSTFSTSSLNLTHPNLATVQSCHSTITRLSHRPKVALSSLVPGKHGQQASARRHQRLSGVSSSRPTRTDQLARA